MRIPEWRHGFVAAAVVLAGCATQGSLLDSPRSTASESRPAGGGNDTSGPSAGATTGAPGTPGVFDPAKAQLDLTDPKGTACQAISDTGLAGNVMLMGKVAAELGFGALKDSSADDAHLQKRLDGIKPQMRELSRRVVWLPEASEVLIGNQLERRSPQSRYKPPKGRQQALIDNVMTPIFDAMRSYAVDTLKTDQNFRMVLYVEDARRSPSMLPGGVLLVPSGMVKTLASRPKDADQVVAFMFAHEFSHALRRHVTKSTQQTVVDGLLQAQVFRRSFKGLSVSGDVVKNLSGMFDLSQSTLDAAVNVVCGTEKWRSEFVQTQEFEADVCGTLLISKLDSAGKHYNAVAGLRGYREMVASLQSMPAPPAAADTCVTPETHPEIEQRERNIQAYQLTLSRGR